GGPADREVSFEAPDPERGGRATRRGQFDETEGGGPMGRSDPGVDGGLTGGRLLGVDRDEPTPIGAVIAHRPRCPRVQGVVVALSDTGAGVDLGATLADQDRAGR